MSILVGFKIPSGERVEIPDEGHAAFFGQTQLSGKTTLIEGITYRAPANVKVLAFITKRGEGSFLTARTIPPYFSEPSNDPEQPLWRWVCAILEASQRRKLRFEESWIIRACEEPKWAKSLADVHANIIALVEGEGEYVQKSKKKRVWHWERKPVTGINRSVYTSLKAYFDIVMPQLQRMPYTKTLNLEPGLNVMDLREYSMEAQGMVIRSGMEFIYRHERNCRVVVPEAQDFVPQGKNSPVKMACETLVRKGAADKNFMWLDSQDMAAVDKVMLRAVSILGVGVQGEAHEMGRAIAHLFGVTTKLTPRDIGSLKLGQFYLRLAGGEVTKVYVQPAWMDSEVHAKAIAMGQQSVSSARRILNKFVADRKPHQQLQILEQEGPNAEEKSSESVGHVLDSVSSEESAPITRHGSPVTSSEETMYKEKYETLEIEFEQLRKAHDAIALRLRSLLDVLDVKDNIHWDNGIGYVPLYLLKADSPVALGKSDGRGEGAAVATKMASAAPESVPYVPFETLFIQIKERAAKEPGLLQLLVTHPELRVHVQRTVIEYDGVSITGRIARLLADGFFDQPKNGPAVQKEMKRRGCDQPTTNLYKPLNKLTEQGFLTLEPDGFRAVAGMKMNIVEQK